MKKIGLMGGLGPDSAVQFYPELAKFCRGKYICDVEPMRFCRRFPIMKTQS